MRDGYRHETICRFPSKHNRLRRGQSRDTNRLHSETAKIGNTQQTRIIILHGHGFEKAGQARAG